MTTTFLLTNTETETDYENNQAVVHLFGRTVDRDPVHVRVYNYPAHFYVETQAVEGQEDLYLGDEGIRAFDHDTGFTAFGTDTPLSRVEVDIPQNAKSAAGLFSDHYGADVPLDTWLRIERGMKSWVTVPAERVTAEDVSAADAPFETDPEPRAVTLDIEVDDRGGFPEMGEKRVTSIVAHDNYDDEYVGFIDGDGRSIESMFPNGKPEEVDRLHVESDERRMLIAFASWLSDRDPDVCLGWNMDGFDAPYLIERMKAVGASPARLSRLGKAFVKRNGTPCILGRSVYDLLEGYKSNSWGELRSYSLDYVAGEELGASKLHHDEGYFQMWQENPELLVDYNARDVRLTVGINEKAGVVSFRDTLRKQIGVNFEETKNNYQFVEMLARRKLYERGEVGPTTEYTSGADGYEGAFVFDAYSGVARNVVGIDVESLYPWTMFMLNASPDVRVTEAFDGPVATAPNGARFRLDRDGLFKTLVEEAIGLKEGYRTKKDTADPGSEEQAMWAEKYAVAKTVTNSIYGVCGWERFFLYDRATAEAVTLAGQAVIQATAKYVNEETIASVLYGDTDSNYIEFPESFEQAEAVSHAMSICEQLEGGVYPAVAESMGVPADTCEWRIGPEMYAPRFLMWGAKKKYAYRSTWKEGMDVHEVMDEPEVVVKGSASKRSDSSRLTRDTEKKVIRAILEGREADVEGYVYDAAKKIDPENPAWDEIGIPGGIRKPLDEYASPTAHVRAAKYANELCGTEFADGSKPMRCYIRQTYFDQLGEEIEVIGYEDADDLRPVADRLVVDTARMTDTLLVNPLGDMLDAVGVDVDAAVSGQSQTGLASFL